MFSIRNISLTRSLRLRTGAVEFRWKKSQTFRPRAWFFFEFVSYACFLSGECRARGNLATASTVCVICAACYARVDEPITYKHIIIFFFILRSCLTIKKKYTTRSKIIMHLNKPKLKTQIYTKRKFILINKRRREEIQEYSSDSSQMKGGNSICE